MTGMEILAQKIAERYDLSAGNAKQSVNSVTAKRIIETLADNAGLLDKAIADNLAEREIICERRTIRIERELEQIRQDKCEIAREKHRISDEKIELEKKRKELEQLGEELKLCETPESRDRIRMYYMLKNDVEIKTAQNNSVYIAGLATILSGQPVWRFTDSDMKIEQTENRRIINGNQNENRK